MGFVAGTDLSTGDIVTATDWNNYNGASNSIDYLETELTKLYDLDSSLNTVLSLDTTYQNTSGKIRVVQLGTYMNNTQGIAVVSDSGSSPTTAIGSLTNRTGVDMSFSFSFLVPPGYYYRVNKTGTPALTADIYDMH